MNDKRYLTVALPKGRLADLTVDMLEKLGIDCAEMKTDTRKLIFTDEAAGIRFFLVKPSDVPTYVGYGAADIGIAGRDTLLEEGRDLYEVLNLKFGACRMVLAGPASLRAGPGAGAAPGAVRRVATKYPRVAKEYFYHVRKESVEVIKLNGSVELAPLVGLADAIVDIVESGRTLKENGLEVLETISDISARLIVNRVSMKMENARIAPIIEGLARQLGAPAGGNDDAKGGGRR